MEGGIGSLDSLQCIRFPGGMQGVRFPGGMQGVRFPGGMQGVRFPGERSRESGFWLYAGVVRMDAIRNA
jgi:hypothetical protein